MRIRTYWSAIAVAGVMALGAQPAQARGCPGFIVGKANSTAYEDGKLPAKRAAAKGIQCSSLRGLARAFHRGTIEIPEGSMSSGAWGDPFEIEYRGRQWNCEFWSIGLSGPSYKLRCTWGDRQARWTVG